MSSSSDEDLSGFKEALDPSFTLGHGDKRKSIKASKRRDKKYSGSEEGTGCLQTTEGFRKYVGDALSKRLDNLIDEVKYSNPKNSSPENEDELGGVQLFSSTELITKFKDEYETSNTKRQKPDLLAHRRSKKKKKVKVSKESKNSSSSSSDDEYLKEVAVTPDWVLQQKGVFKHPPKEADENISLPPKSKTVDPNK